MDQDSIEAEFRQRVMERVQVAANEYVDAAFLMRHIDPKVDLVDEVAHRLLFSLRSYVLAETIADAREAHGMDFPNSPWQMWKERHMPEWFTSRWPVRCDKIEFHVSYRKLAWYPAAPYEPMPGMGPVRFQEYGTAGIRRVGTPE